MKKSQQRNTNENANVNAPETAVETVEKLDENLSETPETTIEKDVEASSTPEKAAEKPPKKGKKAAIDTDYTAKIKVLQEKQKGAYRKFRQDLRTLDNSVFGAPANLRATFEKIAEIGAKVIAADYQYCEKDEKDLNNLISLFEELRNASFDENNKRLAALVFADTPNVVSAINSLGLTVYAETTANSFGKTDFSGFLARTSAPAFNKGYYKDAQAFNEETQEEGALIDLIGSAIQTFFSGYLHDQGDNWFIVMKWTGEQKRLTFVHKDDLNDVQGKYYLLGTPNDYVVAAKRSKARGGFTRKGAVQFEPLTRLLIRSLFLKHYSTELIQTGSDE